MKRETKFFSLAGRIFKSEAKRVFENLTGGEKAETLLKARLKQALDLTDHLGNLKGAAMKFGQLLALEAREFFPDEVVKVLEKLQSAALPVDYETIKKTLMSELGEKSEEIKNFSYDPIASASIGQVHTGFIGGKKVAIKIQYPEISDSLEPDLKVLKNFASVASMLAGKPNIDYTPLIDEIRDVFKQELDYQNEAFNQKKYGELAMAYSPFLKVPELFSKYCTKKILTQSFESGVTVSDAVRNNRLSKELRQHYSHLFLDLYTKEFCDWGLVQTDPNLGNFLLDIADKKLVLLDFGATKTYDDHFRKVYSELLLSAFDNKKALCLEKIFELGLIDKREKPSAQEALTNLLVASMEPFHSRSYSFDDEDYAKKMRLMGVALVKELKFSPPPRQVVFLHRKLGGIFQIMRRLNVTMNLYPYLERFKA